jgi:hypothetical protein
MTTEQLVKLHTDLCEQARRLMKGKNHDYTTSKTDALENLRFGGALGVVTRMHDKLMRLKSLIVKENAAVRDESIDDTCLDLVNYSVLLLALINERGYQREDAQEVEATLRQTTDASVWAREFVKIYGGDVGLMISWFANAIENAKDHHTRPAPVKLDEQIKGNPNAGEVPPTCAFCHLPILSAHWSVGEYGAAHNVCWRQHATKADKIFDPKGH